MLVDGHNRAEIVQDKIQATSAKGRCHPHLASKTSISKLMLRAA
jgi:hypothetical protein